jgi:hypothetical protein
LREREMKPNDSVTSKVQDLRPLLDGIAKNLVERVYGRGGLPWGTTLTELEDVAVAIRTTLAERLMHHALTRQANAADRPTAYLVCPSCQGPVEPREDEQRIVHTRAGDAQWAEPQSFCPACRRAFFPSEPQPGAGPH